MTSVGMLVGRAGPQLGWLRSVIATAARVVMHWIGPNMSGCEAPPQLLVC